MRLRPWLSPQVLISSETSLGITDDALRGEGNVLLLLTQLSPMNLGLFPVGKHGLLAIIYETMRCCLISEFQLSHYKHSQ